MADLYQAEGFYYSRDHLIEAGCIENHEDHAVFAFHSFEEWAVVADRLRSVWGYDLFWWGPHLIKCTSMKGGKSNYVFHIRRAASPAITTSGAYPSSRGNALDKERG